MDPERNNANWDYLNGKLDGGWDMVQVSQHSLKEHFKCLVCLTLPRYPYVTECGHYICAGCAIKNYTNKYNKITKIECSACGSECNISDLSHLFNINTCLKDIYNTLQVTCNYCTTFSDCPTKMLKHEVNECMKRPVKCLTAGCMAVFPINELDKHCETFKCKRPSKNSMIAFNFPDKRRLILAKLSPPNSTHIPVELKQSMPKQTNSVENQPINICEETRHGFDSNDSNEIPLFGERLRIGPNYSYAESSDIDNEFEYVESFFPSAQSIDETENEIRYQRYTEIRADYERRKRERAELEQLPAQPKSEDRRRMREADKAFSSKPPKIPRF